MKRIITLKDGKTKEITFPVPITKGTEEEIEQAVKFQKEILDRFVDCGRRMYPIIKANLNDKASPYFIEFLNSVDISTELGCFDMACFRLEWGDAEGESREMIGGSFGSHNAKTVMENCAEMQKVIDNWEKQIKGFTDKK